MKLFGAILFIIMSLVWAGARFYADHVQFNVACGGHIERAAHANSVELAASELDTAVKYLENNNMTSGYTSVLYQTPNEDIGFWYKNLKTSLDELKGLPPDASGLEKSNVLLKLHETLIRSGDQGKQSINVPPGISVFPGNKFFAVWGTISVVLCIFGVLLGLVAIEDM